MREITERYLEAMVADTPAAVPAPATLKFTENGQRLELGDGVWNTATGRGGYELHIADIEAGQSVFMGTIREADVPTIFVARLHVTRGTVAEAETLVIRNREAAASLDAIGTPRAVWHEAVAPERRHTRAELVRIANLYFAGIERNDGKGEYPIAAHCARLENGAVTAGDPALVLPPALRASRPPRRTGCLEQFQSGVFYYVTRIRDRRFVALDPERGLAFAFAFFDNASGDARFGTLADGRPAESGPVIPWTWQIAEVFKIEDGLIGPVESVLHGVPYGMGSGFSTWEESMSSEPRTR